MRESSRDVSIHIEPRDSFNWAIVQSTIADDPNAKNFGERVAMRTKYFSTLESATRHAVDWGMRVGGLDALIAQKEEILNSFGIEANKKGA